MKIIFSQNTNLNNLIKFNSIFWSSSTNPSSIVRINSNFILQKRLLATRKSYDKKIKLNPIDIHYRYDDSQFLSGPSWANEPFIKPTDDEMIELTKLKLEKDIQTRIEVDPKQEPFKQVFEGQEDYGRFTNCEVIKDEDGSLWKWVERLMPRQTLGEMRKESQIIPPINNKPSSNLSYYVRRTRSRLYPIYKDYAVVGRNKRTYWQNRWDHLFNKYNKHILDKLDDIKWENNEKTIVITKVLQIQGDIWQFEKDSREFLQNYYQQQPIMTGVNEVKGSVEFKGDFIEGMQKFFQEKGF